MKDQKPLSRSYMFHSNEIQKNVLPRAFHYLFAVVFLSLAFVEAARAQTTTTSSVTDGRTPSGLQPGSPAGSYSSSAFDNVNLYNGNLNFNLPLLAVGGRGSAGMTINVALNLKGWHFNHTHKEMPDGNTIDTYVPTQLGWAPYGGYGPGYLGGRNYGLQTSQNISCRWYSKTLSRLTFSTADGTEYELRDQLTNGQPLNSTCTQGAYRGTVFITADGSAATFISDTAVFDNPAVNTFGPHGFSVSGFLLLRDGTRYRVDDSNVTWIRDRNGNKVSFVYTTSGMTITDSLNRTVTVNYNVSDVAPYGLCDQIIYKGFGGASRMLRVSHTNLGSVLRPNSGYSITTLGGANGLFPEMISSQSSNIYDPERTSAVWLPDGRNYKFYYNSYGELARVELPTGGAIEYDMTPGSGVVCLNYCTVEDDRQIYRRVVQRRVYSSGGGGSSFDHKDVYINSEAIGVDASSVTVEQSAAGGTILARRRHYFNGSALNSMFGGNVSYAYGAWWEGNEIQADVLDIVGDLSSATVLSRTVTNKAQRASVSWWAAHASTYGLDINKEPPNDPRVTEIISTIEPTAANLVSKKTFGYDDSVPFNNQNNVKEYDFGIGTPGNLLRETRTSFITDPGYTGTNVHLRNLANEVSVFDGGGTLWARSSTEYDNYLLDGPNCEQSNHCALESRSNISGFDSSFNTGYTTRGNPTSSSRYLIASGIVTGSVSSYSHYDIVGNVVRIRDARGYITKLFYEDVFGSPNGNARINSAPSGLAGSSSFAFPTKITNALGHSVYSKFDYYLGEAVDGENANGIVSSGYFNDSLDRPTQIRQAMGSSLENQTTFAYDDVNRFITTSRDQLSNGDNVLVTRVLYDLMGRTIEARKYEGGTNYTVTQTQYDALGRAYKTSNPFRPWQSETALWTTQNFDALGRAKSVTTPDNAVVSTTYSGNTVTVTDQMGQSAQECY
jgi:YD repeat-containing protein